MGHTFLFRGEPKGRADSLDRWLAILSADAMLLSDLAGGSRSLVRLAEALESLAVERERKGRKRYRASVAEEIEHLASCQSEMMADPRGRSRIYPSLARHMEKKTQYALRLAKNTDTPLVCGASAMKEVSFGLSLARDVAHLCPQYLDPSEKAVMKRTREMSEMIDDKLSRALVCEMAGQCEYTPFLAEADEAVTEYRRFLRELSVRSEEGRLLSVFPSSFLVWADGTCALVHRLLKRLASGKSLCSIADETEELVSDEAMRTAPPMVMEILAEHSESEESARDEGVGTQEENAPVCGAREVGEEQASDEEISPVEETAVLQEAIIPLPEKIYAKASDYKNIVEKAVKKSREHTMRTPRPLGKRR